jgi:SAM-dependent methyltransferase
LKSSLTELLTCPACGKPDLVANQGKLTCVHCRHNVKLVEGIPVFTDTPVTIEPWQKVERGPDQGTAWRRANWRYLSEKVKALKTSAVILDVGAGHGDFAEIFSGRNYFSLDIVPYSEVDLVTDLTQVNPFKNNTFDLVVLMNVLEHVYSCSDLIKSISRIIKPEGQILLTVPFLLKVHQAPFDFARYTPYFFERMAEDAGFSIESLDGYYDTHYLLNESLGNTWQYSIRGQSFLKRLIAKSLVFVIQRLVNALRRVSRGGFIADYKSQVNPSPVGYLLVLKKK